MVMPPAAIIATLVVLSAISLLSTELRADTSPEINLSGTWLSQSGDDADWMTKSFNDATWRSVALPGGSLSAGYNWYRKHFTLPITWGGDSNVVHFNRLYLHLGSLHGAAVIYLNGYQIDQLGKLPSKGGQGFQAIAQSDDVTVIVPVTAGVQDQGTRTIVNWGADNVIAVRLYSDSAGPNPASGRVSIDLPTIGELYPTTFSTDQTDHLFSDQSQVEYTLSFTNTTDTAVPLDWSTDIFDDKGAALSGYTPQDTTGTIDPSSTASYKFSLAFGSTPGFFTFSVNTKIGSVNLSPTTFVAGWDVDKIKPDEYAAVDYNTFWTVLRSDASGGSLDPVVNKDSADAAPGVSVFRVQYNGLGGGPEYAWASVPDTLPTNPVVILHIPAEHADPITPDTDLAKRGYIVLDVDAIAPNWTSGNASDDYLTSGIGSQNTYIMRRIEGNMLRAVRLVDAGVIPGIPAQHRLVVWGESQGGGLALITAGMLKDEISGVVAISPYFSDMSHTLLCVQAANNPFAPYLSTHPDAASTVDTTLSYFDADHAAPKITAPVFFTIGLADQIIPPYSEFATANGIVSPRTMDIEPDSGHIPADARTSALTWLAATLK